MEPFAGPVKLKTASPPEHVEVDELTEAERRELMVTLEFPVTGFEHVPSLTFTSTTSWVEVTAGTVSVAWPEPSNEIVAATPFKV
jgi:hypothetical protein